MIERVTVEVNGQKLHLVLGHTKQEWKKEYGKEEELWDFLLEELLNGAIDIQEDIWYWYINGRCYETYEDVED